MRGGLLFVVLVASVGLATQREIPRFAFDRHENPLAIPLVLNVFLVGFDGEGAHNFKLSAEKLEQFMFDIFPTHHPSCYETGENLHVAFEIWYNVVQLHSTYVESTWKVLQTALHDTGETMLKPETKEQGEVDDGAAKDVKVFTIDVKGAVHTHLASLYDEHTRTARYKTKETEDGNPRAYALFILNPDKKQMKPQGVADGEDFVYRYHTVGTGTTSSFVSDGRFAVLDLSSGPSQFGHSDQGQGTVTPRTFPNPADFVTADATQEEARQWEFIAQLSRNIQSAVQHVFAPDVRFDALDFSEKVLVPIIVFRNHLRFDPLEGGHPYSIDIKKVNETLHGLVLPGQEIEIVWGVHALGEHERVAMAVAAASRSDSVHEVRDGKFKVRAKHYLDSSRLFQELSAASDFLTAGLLGSSTVLSKTYFPDTIDDATQGTRVLPVFIFSLLDDGEPMLVDRSAHYAASKDAVVVLQSNVDDIDMPFFVDGAGVESSGLNPTAHIIAGLAEAMGGLVPPHASHSQLHKSPMFDYTWSIGFHPFGPFSNFTSLTPLHVDLHLRNSIVSRCDGALAKVQDALTLLSRFSEAYLTDPWGNEVDSTGPPPANQIVEYLYGRKTNAGALSFAVVDRLHNELQGLQSMFEQAAEVLYYLDLDKAHRLADLTFRKASAFHKYVEDELNAADRSLFCCNVEHTVVTRTNWPLILRCAIGGLFACALVLLILGYTPADPSHLARRFSRRGKTNLA